MTIGTFIDHIIEETLIAVGRIANRALEALAPFDEKAAERALAEAAADALADLEAQHETTQPQHPYADLADWERELLHHFHRYSNDGDDDTQPLGEYPDIQPQ